MTSCAACHVELVGNPRFCPECGEPVATEISPSGQVRKTVTVLFADLAGSTALGEQLDPEAVRALLTNYFAELKAICELHGATVEKFIGDAVMAVFGIPVVHEDDALRAVRAAADIKERVAVVSKHLEERRGIALRVRIGINTGQVVAGTASTEGTLVTGDPVNTAARLEQAAAVDEIVIGSMTFGLVRDAIEAEELAPIDARGKQLPIRAWRVLDVHKGVGGRTRQGTNPIVGRHGELSLLQQAWRRVLAERRPHLVTILGEAGIGKSRLVREFTSGIDPGARILFGACLPYGEGITYWPLRGIVHAVAGIDEDDDADTARDKLAALIDSVPEGPAVLRPLGAAVGLSTDNAPSQEVPLAVRRLVEFLARETPIVIVVDDLQWAEATFVDLVVDLCLYVRAAQILIICLARPELLERRPTWSSEVHDASHIRLEPLAAEEAVQLIDGLPGGMALPGALRTKITKAAGGNPLYVEELIGMLIDEGRLVPNADGGWDAEGDLASMSVPPSIHALISARLEMLPEEERLLAVRASVVGSSFERAAAIELSPPADRAAVTGGLLGLVRKDVVNSRVETGLRGDDLFSFRHLLIRDAAYDSLPKADRAELHERFAAWLERVVGDRAPEYDEIGAHHLEQAYSYRAELGLIDERTERLAREAGRRLAAAGKRALSRGDVPAAVNLLQRSIAVLSPEDSRRPRVLAELAEAIMLSGGDGGRAQDLADEAERVASANNDLATVAYVIARTFLIRALGPSTEPISQAQRMAKFVPILEAAGDLEGAAISHKVLALGCFWSGRMAAALEHNQLCIDLYSAAGDTWSADRARAFNVALFRDGPMKVAAALEEVDRLRANLLGQDALANLLASSGPLLAYAGRFDDARSASRRSRELFNETGQLANAATTSQTSTTVERLAGDYAAAEADLRLDDAALEAMGQTSLRSTTSALLAHVLDERGKLDEALRYSEISERLTAEGDMTSAVMWRTARAKVLARRGDRDGAFKLASDAVSMVAPTDQVDLHAEAVLDLARVHALSGDHVAALRTADEALALYELKGASVPAQRAREFIATLDG